MPALLLVGLLGAGLFGASVTVVRAASLLHSVVNFDVSNPVQAVSNVVEPPPGSIAWKLRYGERINILALGYGGAENDAPWLTDSIMVISIDPPTRRVMEISIPRDLWVKIDAWPDGRYLAQKINAAFEVGNEPRAWSGAPLSRFYQGRDGAGHLAEHVVSTRTGLQFDRYIGVDFKAFREVVDALGGVEVHMDGPLDDCHYPDYFDGYLNHGVPVGYPCTRGAGIHFPAGDYHVNGEQALQLARSRDAIEPDQASDFGRSRRQQMIVAAIRARATVSDAILRAPQLMSALQQDFRTDMDLADLKALFDFGASLGESDIMHMAVTDQNLVDDSGPGSGGCGPVDTFVLCSEDPTFHVWQRVMTNMFVSPRALTEHAPVELVNATQSIPDLQNRVQSLIQPMGIDLVPTARGRPEAHTVVYDLSGERDVETAAWLGNFFTAPIVEGPPPQAVPGEPAGGLVVVMGSDFGRYWYGLQ